jgi:hypothetical protein
MLNDIEEILSKSKGKSLEEIERLALYVYREMDVISWLPFVKAAMERNPVCFNDLNGKSTEDVFNILHDMPDNSIYDSNRLAQPDEVWNFRRGDGIEKSIRISGKNYAIT